MIPNARRVGLKRVLLLGLHPIDRKNTSIVILVHNLSFVAFIVLQVAFIVAHVLCIVYLIDALQLAKFKLHF